MTQVCPSRKRLLVTVVLDAVSQKQTLQSGEFSSTFKLIDLRQMSNMATGLIKSYKVLLVSFAEANTERGKKTKHVDSLMLKTLNIHPRPAWRYLCQSTQCMITIKCAIYGACDPRFIFTAAAGTTALNPQGKEECGCILFHQSHVYTTLHYGCVVCMLSYLAYLDNSLCKLCGPEIRRI